MTGALKVFRISQKSRSAEAYCRRLQKAAAKYDNTPLAFPDTLLRDIFIRNLRDESCREIVICKDPKSLKEACDFAKEWEECMQICYAQGADDITHSSSGTSSFVQSAFSHGSSIDKASVISSMTSQDIPNDLANELAELLDEIQYSLYLVAQPPPDDRDPDDLWNSFMDKRNKKETHKTIPINLEWAKMWIGPGSKLQFKPGGALLQWRVKVPNLIQKASKAMPNNVLFPGAF